MDYSDKNVGVTAAIAGAAPLRLMDQVHSRLRVKHYSLRTEQAYTGWIRRFIMATGRRHPRELGGPEVEQFLTSLAVDGQVAAGTQNQALSALLFLYKEVLGVQLPWMSCVVRAKRPQRLPTVLSKDETRRLLTAMDGRPWLIASLLYGSGMRLMECLRLRVKDIDFERFEITIRQGKGGKDRRTMLPRTLADPLRREVERARRIHQADLAAGFGATRLPYALERKYPRAAREFGWQFVFASVQRSRDQAVRSDSRPATGSLLIVYRWRAISCSALRYRLRNRGRRAGQLPIDDFRCYPSIQSAVETDGSGRVY